MNQKRLSLENQSKALNDIDKVFSMIAKEVGDRYDLYLKLDEDRRKNWIAKDPVLSRLFEMYTGLYKLFGEL